MLPHVQCETLGNPLRSRVVKKHPVTNSSWAGVHSDAYMRAHTQTPDDITQVEDLPSATAIRFTTEWVTVARMNIFQFAHMKSQVMWCVQQYLSELNVSPFLKLEFCISHCWAEREKERERGRAACSGSYVKQHMSDHHVSQTVHCALCGFYCSNASALILCFVYLLF